MLRIGLFGAGHLGKIHLKILLELDCFEVVGFYDADSNVAREVESDFGVKAFADEDTLIDRIDVLDIVTPTPAHYDTALKGLKSGKHIFVEKPLAYTIEQARHLMELAEEAPVKSQVGHVERFNPAFQAVEKFAINPLFIEGHRLSPFSPRGTEVSVVMDLMIHDIDLLLTLVKSNVKKISASGVPVVCSTPDIANARIEFDNGAIANLTASRISLKKMRKMRLFKQNGYFSVDLLQKKAEIFLLDDVVDEKEIEQLNGDVQRLEIGYEGKQRKLLFIRPEITQGNAIQEELMQFHDSIISNKESSVPFLDGYKAINIAEEIQRKIQKRL